MDKRLAITVKLYGYTVGYLAMDGGIVYFEYDDEFKKLDLEISPLKLHTNTTATYTNTDDKFFQSLAGVFHDSLPDKFGNKIIERYYAEKGIKDYDLNILQRLAYIGSYGMGALEYEPNIIHEDIKEALEIRNLVDDARKIISGNVKDTIPDIMESGGSAGGARAKAIIAWNRKTDDIRSGRAKPKEGYDQYLLKFDGVGENKAPADYTKIEFIYMSIAKECGLPVSEVELLKDREYNHLLVKRFDRISGEKVHMHSLCGMTHTDFNIPKMFSYENYLRTVLQVTKNQDNLLSAFSHMIFNVITRNQDDHTKNFSFLMSESGEWMIAPIYDLTYSNGAGYTSEHQMTINGKTDSFTIDDFYSFSEVFGISKSDIKDIVEYIQDTFIKRLSELGNELKVSQDRINRILNNVRKFDTNEDLFDQ